MTIRVLVVDDHPVVQQGLTAVLSSLADIDLVGTAADSAHALQLLNRVDVDVAVIDLQLGAESGLDLLTTLKREHPDVALVVFTMAAEPRLDARVRRAGADGLVSKADSVTVLLDAIRDRGTSPTGSANVGLSTLTNRERDVVKRLVEGASPSEIAAALDVAPSTVSTYLRRSKDKLQVRTVAELVRVWLEPPSSAQK